MIPFFPFTWTVGDETVYTLNSNVPVERSLLIEEPDNTLPVEDDYEINEG